MKQQPYKLLLSVIVEASDKRTVDAMSRSRANETDGGAGQRRAGEEAAIREGAAVAVA